MTSLIQILSKADIKPPLKIPQVFQTYPNSLKEMMRILNLPKPPIKDRDCRCVASFGEIEAQGMTYAYRNYWFLASRYKIIRYYMNDPFKPTYRSRQIDVHVDQMTQMATGLQEKFDHIGDIDYFDGIIFASLRNVNENRREILIALDSNLKVIGFSFLKTKKETSSGGCAINPWNRFLYMLGPDETNPFLIYNVDEYYIRYQNKDSRAWGEEIKITHEDRKYELKLNGLPIKVKGIQGMAFSPHGRLYISRNDKKTIGWRNYVQVYNALTGEQLGASAPINFDKEYDEIEGITVHPTGFVHLAVAINSWRGHNYDDFDIHAFKYQDSTPV